MIKSFLRVIVKAIGKIWNFATRILSVAVIAAFIFAILTIFMPDNVLRAVEIFKGLIP